MYCKKCGKEIKNGKCPACSKKKRWLIALIAVILASAAVAGAFYLLPEADPTPSASPHAAPSATITPAPPIVTGEYRVPMPDADKYYSENSQIISTEKPADSLKLRSASQVYSDFSERGFTSGLTATYTIDGEFLNEESVSSYSNKKYPIYNTVYVTASGDIWVIFEINGTICANPVSKNLTSHTPTVITETDTVMSYDSTLNKFYETVPERDAVRTVKVERIDAITLESGVF